ncbi:RNA-directed DNA polymerase, eukaryota, reverse transcriptase zinc-binding domain protein [Tanacetum coccineum]
MEVKKLIKEENLQFCAILETHVKYKNIKKTCDNVFGNWESIYNGEDNNKGCRIMVGWNTNIIQTWLISHSRQFLQMESIDKKSKFFCTMIYASNSGMERRKLWRDLEMQKKSLMEFHGSFWGTSIYQMVFKKGKEHSDFLTSLQIKKEFLPTVRSVWNKDFEGHTMYRIVQKMKVLKRKLKQISWKNGNVFERAEKLRMEVKECQKEVDNFPHDDKVKDKSYNVLKEYNKAIQDEYSLLCQKAKVEWLREEDKNTAYFHKTIKERVHRGRIITIRNEEGVRFENEEVAIQVVKHFEDFLGKSRIVKKMIERKDIFTNKIKPDEALMMVRPISEAEIKNAMFEIEDSKAPGGYTSRFFKFAWSIVGREVCHAVKEFFLTGKLLGVVNATVITLVPKISTPDKVSDFRPIACCNVLYKCISKILTSRIKGVLGSLVDENQSAFIGGKQITDNILLLQELFRGYNRKQNLKKIMVKWIMTCITSTKFSINVNGERVGYFKGGRGLRQGDPILPYLFTLVMEVLNLLVKKNIEDNMGFQYHFVCKNLKITHLCFADDLLVFCHEDTQSVGIIKKSLDEFSEHTPNMHKSTIFFGGLSNAEQQNILNLMPFTVGRLPVKYLGVPLITKQISISDCKPLVDKVRSKVNDWKNKALSYAGRVQLIASILSSMQNYWASVFLLPKQVIYEINKMLKGFLWCQGELANGKANVSWETVCKPKNQGGLGIKDLGVWNEDMYDARLRNECTAREVIHEGRWKWPTEWNNDFAELDQLQVPREQSIEGASEVTKCEIIRRMGLDYYENGSIAFEQEYLKHCEKDLKESNTVKEVEEKWVIKMQRDLLIFLYCRG